MSVKVLSVTLGGIFPAASGPLSGALARQLDYGRRLAAYHVVTEVRRPAEGPLAERHLDGAVIWPTNDRGRLDYVAKAVALGDRVIREHGIDVVTCADPGFSGLAAMILAKRHQLPLDVNVMSDIVDNPAFLAENPVKHRVGLALSHRVLALADGIRVSTDYEVGKLRGRFGDRVYLARFYVDPAPYAAVDPAAAAAVRRKLLGEGPDRPIVLFVGRLAAQKHLDVLLEAAAVMKRDGGDALFALVGYGPEGERLKARARELGLGDQVAFTGPVPHGEVPAYFQACDLFAITSRHEGTCMVLLEAALAGKPIVATRFAGAIDLLAGRSPETLVDLDDAAGVARAVAGLIADPARRAALGAALREHVRVAYEPGACAAARVAAWERLALAGRPA